jgi:hypothetical protein
MAGGYGTRVTLELDRLTGVLALPPRKGHKRCDSSKWFATVSISTPGQAGRAIDETTAAPVASVTSHAPASALL